MIEYTPVSSLNLTTGWDQIKHTIQDLDFCSADKDFNL